MMALKAKMAMVVMMATMTIMANYIDGDDIDDNTKHETSGSNKQDLKVSAFIRMISMMAMMVMMAMIVMMAMMVIMAMT